MDLTCFLHPGWAPLIRPAPASRRWMDDTPESFAYRCLPLNIANAHGWEILSPCGFEAMWTGDTGTDGVTIRADDGAQPERVPVSLFGQGVLTFHVEGIFRTPPGWNLWVGPSPNRSKDGIAALTGIIETDWSPFTFTMNWRFTRPDHWTRFDALEPFCFLFPVQRSAIEEFKPRFETLDADPETKERFHAWSRARDEFHGRVLKNPPSSPTERWQKHYYRGVDVAGTTLIKDHRSKLRLQGFDRSRTPTVPEAPLDDRMVKAKSNGDAQRRNCPASGTDDIANLRLQLAKREWLLETLEAQRSLAPKLVGIERRAGLTTDEFLGNYYAANRPVILTGEMADWPALEKWTPSYLKDKVGPKEIEFQGGRTGDPAFERQKDLHRSKAKFDDFIEMISKPGSANDAYMTAYNSAQNVDALAPLQTDMGELTKFLDPNKDNPFGMMWVGPAGTQTSLHHDLTNNLVAQLVGRKAIKLLPASEVGKLYNDCHVFSEVADLDDPTIDLARYSRLSEVIIYDVVLYPGEAIFIPLGWWHQVKALDFSVTVTYTNFLWPNDACATYPTA